MGLCDSQKQAELICLTGQRIRNFFWGTITRRMDTGKKNKERALPSPAQLQVLDIVIAHDRISITELAKKMMVSPPSTSIMVDHLVNCGWLHRKRCVQDRRKVLLSVTGEAKEHIEEFHTILREEIIHLIKLIGPESTQKWCEVLREIEQACCRNVK